MTHLVNQILEQAIANFDVGFLLIESNYGGEDTLVLNSRNHLSKRWFHCPLCHKDFRRAGGQKLRVKLRNNTTLNVLICSEDHDKEEKDT